jgi:hypothetical protein
MLNTYWVLTGPEGRRALAKGPGMREEGGEKRLTAQAARGGGSRAPASLLPPPSS